MQYISQSLYGDLVHWNIERPKRCNALGPSVVDELFNKITDLDLPIGPLSQPRPKVLLITATPVEGGNEPIWISGGDLQELSALNPIEARSFFEKVRLCGETLLSLPMLVVSVVDGIAIGGGVEFALFADYRLCTSRSKFYFKQLQIHLPFGFIGTRRLSHLIGLANLERCLLEQSIIDADNAAQLGIIHQVIQQNTLLFKKHESDLDPAFSHDIKNPLIKKIVLELRDHFSSIDSKAIEAYKRMIAGLVRHHPGVSSEFETDAFLSAWRNPGHDKFLNQFRKRTQANDR